MMDQFKERIENEQNILERIVEIIPGYRSYRQRERRRDVDKALRTYVANRIRDFMTRLRNLSKPLTDSGRIAVLDDLDTMSRRLEAVSDKVRFASYGYAGFFDVIKIKENELEALYAFDVKLLDSVNNLYDLLKPEEETTLVADSVKLADRFKQIENAVRHLETLLLDRTNLIVNVKGL